MKTRSTFRQQKKQTRLSFQALPSSSPAKDAYSTAVQDRLASVRFQGASSPLRRSKINAAPEQHDSLPTPEPSSQPQNVLVPDPYSSDDAPGTPGEKSNARNTTQANGEENATDEDEVVVPSSKRRKISSAASAVTPTRQSARLKEVDTPQSSLSLRSRLRHNSFPSSPPADKALSIGSAETSGDEDATLHTQGTTRRRGAQRSNIDDPFIVSDDDDAIIDTAPRTTARSRKRNTAANDFVVDDDEIEYISSEPDEHGSSIQRRRSKKKQRERSRKVQDELDDDLKDLQDSDQSEVIESGRTRGGPVTTQRDRNREHFELLKRRRAGEPIPRIVDSDDDDHHLTLGEDEGVEIDHIADIALSSSIQYNDQSRDSDIEADDDVGEHQGNDGFVEDDEDDFIVEDESQPSRDTRSAVPLAFTSFASSKPRELFIHIVEWLVKNKIAPAFSRDDELYVLSWNKINDQIKAQAGSRLISAAWNQDFKYAIMARPQMEVQLVTGGNDEFFLNCDACNRTNHPARYEFKFTGHAYNKDTLEPIDEDESSNDEDGQADDSASYDQQGHLLPTATRTYNLGRFCAANAEMGHKLTHWKYQLNQSLLTYLEEQGVLSVEAIVAREKLNKKKREKEAEHIVDLMQETGKIDEMWRGLQDDLEDARFGMEDHVAKGGRRNQQRIGKVRVNRADGRIEEWSEGGKVTMVVPSDSEGE